VTVSVRRTMVVCALAVTVLGHTSGGAVHAHGPTIPLPSDLAIDAPAADVPATSSRFVGAWAHGAWDGVLPHVLVVERVDGTGRAQVVYALGDFAEGQVNRGYRRVIGRIVGDLLTLAVSDNASVAYHVAGNSLRGTYSSSRRHYTVTLTRASLAEAMAEPASLPGVVAGTTVRIPILEPGPGGRRLSLEATLYRPADERPHAVLLFNHGSTGGGAVAPSVTIRPSRQARFFVERGFAVLAPMRRGRGASDGIPGEYEGTCDSSVLGAGLTRAIEDVDATMAYLRGQPWADADRVVIAGQSRGGLLSVTYAAARPGTVRGVINFAGGWTSQRCDESDRGFNRTTFAASGEQGRTPMLWLYAEEDTYYSPAWIRRYHEAFAQAGGVATLHVFPAFAADGHRLVDRLELWQAPADAFLRRLNLSSPQN
jgi:dienelactone hydrolase